MTAFNAPSHINNIVVDTIELRFTEMAEYDSNGFNLGEFNFTLAPATPTNYTVTFLGANDTELKVQEVEPGQDASAPVVPFTPGFLFQNSWDHAFTNVTSDLTVRAEFKRAFMVLNYSIDDAVGVYIESDTLTNNGSPVYEHTENNFVLSREASSRWELLSDATDGVRYGAANETSDTPPVGNFATDTATSYWPNRVGIAVVGFTTLGRTTGQRAHALASIILAG